VLRTCVFAIGSATTLLGCGSFDEYPASDVAIGKKGLSKADLSVRDAKRCAPLNHRRFAVFSGGGWIDHVKFARYLHPREQKMVVSTEQVTALPDMPDFGTSSSQFLDSGLKDIITYQLTTSKLADAATAQLIAPVVAAALEEHYAGDESPPDEMTRQIAAMLTASGSAAGQAWGYSLISLHTDRAPADNDVVLSLGGTKNVAH
jgi:hypothetical protein